MALGARPVVIMSMILGQVSMLAGAGLLLGLAGALALSHAASNLLFGVAWTDGRTLAVATLLLFMVALMARYIAATRATRVDPAIALSLNSSPTEPDHSPDLKARPTLLT
jgi:putative ABC transport system permease protein